jgi:hypothetical protein
VGKLIKLSELMGLEPACSVVPQPTMLLRVPTPVSICAVIELVIGCYRFHFVSREVVLKE